MTYEEQLRDPRWLDKRKAVIARDGHKCRRCERTNDLQVHHIRYHDGMMAWEYTHYDLITLCSRCHLTEHYREYGVKMPEGPATVGEILGAHLEFLTRKKNG